MRCILCSNADLILHSNSSYLKMSIFYCQKCNLYITGNSEDEVKKALEEFYHEAYWNKKDISTEEAIKSNFTDINSQGKRRQWTSQYKYCESHFVNKKKILEIGSGQGQALCWFEERGFSVTGIEPDKKNGELINQKLREGHCITSLVEDVKIDEKFDIIWISHVIEHLIRPDKLLDKYKNNLMDDGIIFIEVPNCENRLVLNDSVNTQPHTFHFTKKSLFLLAKICGLEIKSCDYFRAPTLLEGGIHKIEEQFKFLGQKKFSYYPKIIAESKTGTDIRLVLAKI